MTGGMYPPTGFLADLPHASTLPWGKLILDSMSGMCYHDDEDVIMIRTQIQLTAEQSARLRAVAANRGVSMAELIRQGVETILSSSVERSPDEVYRKAREASGKHRSGQHDVSRRHDEYLEEGFSR